MSSKQTYYLEWTFIHLLCFLPLPLTHFFPIVKYFFYILVGDEFQVLALVSSASSDVFLLSPSLFYPVNTASHLPDVGTL